MRAAEGMRRLADDLAGVAGGALSIAAGLREEVAAIRTACRESVRRRLGAADREELEVAMDLARAALARAEAADARAEAAEARARAAEEALAGLAERLARLEQTLLEEG
jgi:hypothetical protein